MFGDRYGITQIRDGRRDNLSIGLEYDDNPEDAAQLYPVFLFTPDMRNTIEHHHIPLNVSQAKQLRDWLTQFLKLKGVE
jgi:hypothetical protein